jgi:hypothetical protein
MNAQDPGEFQWFCGALKSDFFGLLENSLGVLRWDSGRTDRFDFSVQAQAVEECRAIFKMKRPV